MKWGQDSADPRSGESEKVGNIVEVRGVGIKSFVGYSGKLETYPTVDREPVKLLKKRLRVCEAIRLKNNSGEGILNRCSLFVT